MLNRLILLIASAAAALVLAVGLALAGFGPAPADGSQADTAPVDAVATTDVPAESPAATEQVLVDTVYLTPQATPKVIVTKVVRPRATTAPDRVQTAVREHDDENEAEDD